MYIIQEIQARGVTGSSYYLGRFMCLYLGSQIFNTAKTHGWVFRRTRRKMMRTIAYILRDVVHSGAFKRHVINRKPREQSTLTRAM